MRNAVFYCLLGLWLCLAADSVFAGDAGLLDRLDSIMESGEQETGEKEGTESRDQEGLLSQVAEHFGGEFRFRGSRFFEAAPENALDTDKHRNTGEVLLKGSSWMGREFWSLHAAAWLEGGTQEDTYSGVGGYLRDKDRQRRYLVLNESYLCLSGENTDLTLGKKPFKNGLSAIYSPSNRYRSLDLNDPVDPKDLGLWQVALNYYQGDTTWTAAVLPVFQPMKVPGTGSRWMTGGLEGDGGAFILDSAKGHPFPFDFSIMPDSLDRFIEIMYYAWDLFSGEDDLWDLIGKRTVEVEDELSGYGPKDYGWFGRSKFSVGLWDLFVSAYHGPGLYPVLKIEERGSVVAIIKENPQVFNLAAGFSTTWQRFEFHGEALYNRADNDKDDSYVNYVGGVTFTELDLARKLHLDKIVLTAEYAGETITADQDHSGYVVSSRYARIGRDNIFVNALIGVTDDLSLHYLGDMVLWNRSWFHRVGASYRIRSGLVLNLALEFFDGDEQSYFGRWRNNDRIITMLTWNL